MFRATYLTSFLAGLVFGVATAFEGTIPTAVLLLIFFALGLPFVIGWGLEIEQAWNRGVRFFSREYAMGYVLPIILRMLTLTVTASVTAVLVKAYLGEVK